MAKEINERNRETLSREDRNSNPHDRLDENEADPKEEGDYRDVTSAEKQPDSLDDEKESQMKEGLIKTEEQSEKEIS